MNKRFRVYDNYKKRYVTNEQLWVIDTYGDLSYIDYGDLIGDDDCIIEWEIGLTDKDGKSIFEGDIIQNLQNKIGYVTFLQQELGYVVVWKNHDTRLGHRSTGSWYEQDPNLKIIGNIHDNLGLLEKTR